ncbi:MAG: hypothetical protein EOL88_01490 [Bacteroidia bacterium]|nr:hypothetical protein [Bacteroidia bacterium]
MADSSLVKMGVCNVSYKGTDLGYTSGFVKVSYSAESIEKKVDQADAALDELITSQSFEVTVPMAEYDLSKFVNLFPGATLTGTGDTQALALSGASGGSMIPSAGLGADSQYELIITPIAGGASEKITVHYAVPKPSLEFSFEKENVRVYEITFRALKGTDGWVTFGYTAP